MLASMATQYLSPNCFEETNILLANILSNSLQSGLFSTPLVTVVLINHQHRQAEPISRINLYPTAYRARLCPHPLQQHRSFSNNLHAGSTPLRRQHRRFTVLQLSHPEEEGYPDPRRLDTVRVCVRRWWRGCHNSQRR